VSRLLQVRTKLRPTDSPSEIYAKVAETMPKDVMLSFGPGIWRELRQELKSVDAVAEWAIALTIRLDRVLLLNIPDRDGSSHTLTLAPPAWSRERLQGYVAARHEELEEAYGPIARVGPIRPEAA
jgi:hypothetical protein